MYTSWKLFFAFILATVFYWALSALLGGWGINVNLMLVFAMAVCAVLKPEYGYPTAFLCGLFLDFFGVKLFGHQAFIFTLCAVIIYTFQNRLDLDSPVPQAISTLVLVLLADLCDLLFLKIFAGVSAWSSLGAFIGGLLLSAALAPIVFWATKQWLAVKEKTY